PFRIGSVELHERIGAGEPLSGGRQLHDKIISEQRSGAWPVAGLESIPELPNRVNRLAAMMWRGHRIHLTLQSGYGYFLLDGTQIPQSLNLYIGFAFQESYRVMSYSRENHQEVAGKASRVTMKSRRSRRWRRGRWRCSRALLKRRVQVRILSRL